MIEETLGVKLLKGNIFILKKDKGQLRRGIQAYLRQFHLCVKSMHESLKSLFKTFQQYD
jgi:hypothetical protein